MVKKSKIEKKTSIKSYQQGIDIEKEKMTTYSNKFKSNVKSLQNEFKRHQKELKEAALNMREEGIKNMKTKVNKFKGEIKGQINENKEAVSKMENGVKLFIGEINKKKRDFQAYAKGPFQAYIKAFWG